MINKTNASALWQGDRGFRGEKGKKGEKGESGERGGAGPLVLDSVFSFQKLPVGGLMIINEISVQLQGRAGEKGEPGLTVCTILIITLKRNQHQATFK